MNRVIKGILHTAVVSIFIINLNAATKTNTTQAKLSEVVSSASNKIINKIILTRKNRNKFLTDAVIFSKVPYEENATFDESKTSRLIHNLYEINTPYGFFEQIYVMQENLPEDKINLHIITYEKPELEEIVILGNKQVDDATIDEKLSLGDIQAINEVDIQRIEKALRKIYQEKNFQLVEIYPETYKKGNKASVIFVINEGIKSFVKKVNFVGNTNIRSKDLRKVIYTREDWLLGFMDQSGTYNKEYIDADKYFIESYYKSKGYITAKVTNVEAKMDECSKQYTVTFHVSEGDCYTISDVSAPGNDVVCEEILMMNVNLKKGNVYSERDLQDSIDKLRRIWGVYGYIFADIQPVIIPDTDKKTLSITFNSELGDKVYVNRINIKGNKKTRDRVIRRRLTFAEGNLLTSSDMEASKMKVENLGYFDPREGVNWKINRIDDTTADLDLILKEVKTGKLNFQAGFGGSDFNIFSAARSFKLGGGLSDINFMGTGIITRLSGSWSQEEWSAAINIANPWMFERPMLGEIDFHVTKADYADELSNDVSSFTEKLIGGFVGLGFTISNTILKDTAASVRLGGENIKNSSRPKVDSLERGALTLQRILDLAFQTGNFAYMAGGLAKDYRNNSMHPSAGYQWAVNTKLGVSGGDEACTKNGFGFGKIDFDATWYTPLIGYNTLIFGAHAHAGIIGTFKDKDVPYRELYHIGGPASVRGFLYGQIGPMFLGNSIGAKKAFWVNIETIFPITQDFNLKGAIFYDGGAGWDAAYQKVIPADQCKLLLNNNFNFRHAIGIGFRMISPQPIKIDVGFKLDKRKGEHAVEVHFSANRDF